MDTHMTDSAPKKQPRRSFANLMAYHPQKNSTANSGVKWALILTAVLIVIAFYIAIAILLPYLNLLDI